MSGLLDRILQEAERIGSTSPPEMLLNGARQAGNNALEPWRRAPIPGFMRRGVEQPIRNAIEPGMKAAQLVDAILNGMWGPQEGRGPLANPAGNKMQVPQTSLMDLLWGNQGQPPVGNPGQGFNPPVDAAANPAVTRGNLPPTEPGATEGESADPYDATPQSVIALRKLAAQNQEGVPSRDTINNNMAARNQGQFRGMPAAVPGWEGNQNRPTSAAQINGRPNWAHVMNPNAPRTEMMREPGSARPQGEQFNPEVNQQRIAEEWAVRNANVAVEQEALDLEDMIDVTKGDKEVVRQLEEAGAYKMLEEAAPDFNISEMTPLQIAAAWNILVQDINKAKRATASEGE